jgi:hypothetical protein
MEARAVSLDFFPLVVRLDLRAAPAADAAFVQLAARDLAS